MSKKKIFTSEPYGSIKPCPFCGWGTIVNGGLLNYRCQCNACGATTKGYPTWEMAMEAWNRRYEPPEPEHPMEEFMFGQDIGNPEDGSL